MAASKHQDKLFDEKKKNFVDKEETVC